MFKSMNINKCKKLDNTELFSFREIWHRKKALNLILTIHRGWCVECKILFEVKFKEIFNISILCSNSNCDKITRSHYLHLSSILFIFKVFFNYYSILNITKYIIRTYWESIQYYMIYLGVYYLLISLFAWIDMKHFNNYSLNKFK